MSREIKFRGKRLDSKEWMYGSLVTVDDTAVIVEGSDFSWDPRTDAIAFWFDIEENEVDFATVGQYTGLKDKNGKEIYEGDILMQVFNHGCDDAEHNSGTHIGVVRICARGVCLHPCTLQYEDDNLTVPAKYKPVTGNRSEIIGNIHDNPELLKGGNNEI